mmetsp:Transcript_59378/g.134413  ORF Transcript_59378/g.134413 Transcript_59378/m.134413 type:complete len:450 (+) Transcript_59378:691-2040(+)
MTRRGHLLPYIRLARELVRADPKRTVLVVTVELCSLLYQPSDLTSPRNAAEQQAAVICDSLFGDAAGACLVVGAQSPLLNRPWGQAVRLGLQSSGSYQLPDSLDYMRYETSANGMHFRLTNDVPKAMNSVAPVIIDFMKRQGITDKDVKEMSFLLHTGGPKVLLHFMSQVYKCCNEKVCDGSRDRRCAEAMQTLRAFGNIASVSLFSTVRSRMLHGFDSKGAKVPCLVAGCGPGMGADWVMGELIRDPLQPAPISDTNPYSVLGKFDAVLIQGIDEKASAGLASLLSKRGLRVAIVNKSPLPISLDTPEIPSAIVHGGCVEDLLSKFLNPVQSTQMRPFQEDEEEKGSPGCCLNDGKVFVVLAKAEFNPKGTLGSCTSYEDFYFSGTAPMGNKDALDVITEYKSGGSTYNIKTSMLINCDAFGSRFDEASLFAKFGKSLLLGSPVVAFQ